MWSFRRIIVLSIFTITLSCGFKPLYSDLEKKNKVVGVLKIPKLDDKEGFHLREELIRRLGDAKDDTYTLSLQINTDRINEVITPNNEITSYRLIMTASYTIISKDGATVLQTQESIVRTGFSSSRNSTGFITQIAEEAAKKRLAVKIAEKISTRVMILSENWLK